MPAQTLITIPDSDPKTFPANLLVLQNEKQAGKTLARIREYLPAENTLIETESALTLQYLSKENPQTEVIFLLIKSKKKQTMEYRKLDINGNTLCGSEMRVCLNFSAGSSARFLITTL